MRRLLRKIDGGAELFQPIVDALDAFSRRSTDAGEALGDLQRQMAYDPSELRKRRGAPLRPACRRPQASGNLRRAAILEKYRGDLDTLQSGESRLKALEADEAARALAIWKLPKPSPRAAPRPPRRSARPLEAELPDLKLGAAKFIVDHQVETDRVAAAGFDQIAFHVQTNPGTAAGPLL